MTTTLSPTKLFHLSSPDTPHSFMNSVHFNSSPYRNDSQFHDHDHDESPWHYRSSSRHSPLHVPSSSSPFSSPSKQVLKSMASSPYRAPFEGDSDDETYITEEAEAEATNKFKLKTETESEIESEIENGIENQIENEVKTTSHPSTSYSSTYPRSPYSKLPPKSPNRFVAPEVDDSDEDDEEQNRNNINDFNDLNDITESSLDMHGSFLLREDSYSDFNNNYDSHPRANNETGTKNYTTAIAPFPFSYSTYDAYLTSPLRSPMRSQWDDDDDRGYSHIVPPSPSRLLSPELLYLLDDLAISPKRELPAAPEPIPKSVVSYTALSHAIQEESARELSHAEDEYAVSVQTIRLRRKADAIKNQVKIKEEEERKEAAHQKNLNQILIQKAQYERETKERIEREQLEHIRKQEEERKRVEDERLRLEALERKKKAEELQKKMELEKKQREEEERKKQEELEGKRAEEEKKQQELKKRQEEEERRRYQEAEAKRIAEENEKKRQEVEEKLKRENEEVTRKAEEQKREQEQSNASVSSLSPSVLNQPEVSSQQNLQKEQRKEAKKYISKAAAEELAVLENNYKTVLPSIQACESNPAFKDTKRKITMDINVKLGQLCPDRNIVTSRTHELARLCQDAVGQGDGVAFFCLNLLSIKIMRQTALVEKPQSVFPLAAMIVGLLQKIPALEKILTIKFYEYCPYTVPRYARREPSQTDSAYFLAQGYLLDDSRVEDEASFYARMEGAVRLFAAIIQTPCNGQHPYGPVHGWTWLARLANMPPTDITATILRVFLEIAGHELLRVYRVQFHKLMAFLHQDFVPICPKARPSDHDRLIKILESYLRTGSLSPPEGRDF